MIVSEDDPRIPRRPLTCDSLKEVEKPIDGSPHLAALHQGMREGLLTPAARGLTEPLVQGAA